MNNKHAYLLSAEKLGRKLPIGFYNNSYYIYLVYNNDDTIYNGRLFNTPNELMNFLEKLTERKYNNVN
jgi:hypothetical protein